MEASARASRPTRAARRYRLPRFLAQWHTRIALSVLVLILMIALVGPFVTPYSSTALVGTPYAPPSGRFLLGTDYIGEDVFSRLLAGGDHLILYALIATSIAYFIGGGIRLLAGYSRSLIDPILMRTIDLLLAFPAIFLVLILAARFGSGAEVVIIGIAFIHIPLIARILRTATLETSVRGFVEAAVARGDSTLSIQTRDPAEHRGPIMADAGPRLTISILLIAAVNFLGWVFGHRPPSWAVMISENRPGWRSTSGR